MTTIDVLKQIIYLAESIIKDKTSLDAEDRPDDPEFNAGEDAFYKEEIATHTAELKRLAAEEL